MGDENVQLQWENTGIILIQTVVTTVITWLLVVQTDISFEVAVIFMLSLILAFTSSIWRSYVRGK